MLGCADMVPEDAWAAGAMVTVAAAMKAAGCAIAAIAVKEVNLLKIERFRICLFL
jgi:hypothetical protein